MQKNHTAFCKYGLYQHQKEMKTITENLKATLQTTLIEQMKVLNESMISTMCSILGWTEQQYCDHQFESYESFVFWVYKRDNQHLANKVRYSPIFRGLWNNEWLNRNDKFVHKAKYDLFSGFEIDESGELLTVPPPDSHTMEKIVYEYKSIHSSWKLRNDPMFMQKFYHALDLISRR